MRDPKETVKFRSWVNGCNAYRTIRSNDGTYIVAFPEKTVALTKAVRYREEIGFQLRAKQTMVKDHSFWNGRIIETERRRKSLMKEYQDLCSIKRAAAIPDAEIIE